MTTLRTADVDLEGLLKVLADNLYSTPEVALRELVQNAHDSCTRRKLEFPGGPEPRIDVSCDGGHLVIRDNGAGLTEPEIHQYLATLGSGYTRVLRASSGSDDLIGAFGLGFLSAYVVADHVSVTTTSAGEPGSTHRFVSRDGRSYSVDAVENEPVGTTVRLQISKGFERLTNTQHVRSLLIRYATLLPIAVHAPDCINAEPAPWLANLPSHRAAKQPKLLAFASRFEPRFEPLVAIEVKPTDGADVHGVIWIQSGGAWATSDQRHVSLFVRGMLITEDARKLLPDWAGFAGAVVASDSLKPTASREDVQKDAAFERIAAHLTETLIEGLVSVAKRDRTAWLKVKRRHNEALLGASLCDDRLFAMLTSELTIPTSEGDLHLEEVAKRNRGRIPVSTVSEQGPEEVLFRALGRPVVRGTRYAALPVMRRYAEGKGMETLLLGTASGDAGLFGEAGASAEVRATLTRLLATDGIEVRPARFAPPGLPAVYVPDREVALKRRIESEGAGKRIGKGLLALARGFTAKTEDGALAKLYVNLDSPLIARLLEAPAGRQEDLATMVQALAELSASGPIEGLEVDLAETLDAATAALLRLDMPD